MKNTAIIILFISFGLFFTNCDKNYNYDDNSGFYPSLNYGLYSDSEMAVSGENYNEYEENPFVMVTDQSKSTFSIDADGGAYSNMRRFFSRGTKPPKEAVRIEEFINYFTFDYEEPAVGENVAMNHELTTCPWNENHHLLRIGLKAKTIPDEELPASNFVFLIDVSGSMSYDDKLEILKAGFIRMTDQLNQDDRIAIVTYAGQAGVLLPSTSGDKKNTIKDAIRKLGAGGSTAGAAGISTAYEIAIENFIEGGNNRVILGSDGDFNVGASSTDELVKLIEQKRESDIYLTVLGVGTGNLNDYMMEQIANKGNGNYEYIDNANQLEKVFVYEKSKFYTLAKDSKFQISFNPGRVEKYRLIGYENRMLKQEDFEKDSVDAGEIGSGQTITAMYELQLLGTQNSEKYASLDFRYKIPGQEQSRLLSQDILINPISINDASENQRFCAAITGFGLMLRESQYKGKLDKQMIIGLAQGARSFDPYNFREECVSLMEDL